MRDTLNNVYKETDTAATDANTAATEANTNAQNANAASQTSSASATATDTASTNANTSAQTANTASQNANTSSQSVNTAATDADTSSTNANTASTNANTASQNANTNANVTNAKSFSTAWSNAKKSFSNTMTAMTNNGVGGFTALAKSSGSFISTFWNGLSKFSKIGIIVTSAIAVIKGIDAYANSLKKKIKEAAETAKSEINTIKSEFDSLKSTTNDVKQRYAELAQGIANLGKANQSQGGLNTEEYEEFLDLSNQLAELFPQLRIGIDDNGNAILDLSGNVDTIVGSLEHLVEVQQQLASQEILEKMPDVWENYVTEAKDYNKQIDELESRIKAVDLFGDDKNKEVTISYKDFGAYQSNMTMMVVDVLRELGHANAYDQVPFYTMKRDDEGNYYSDWDFSSMGDKEYNEFITKLKEKGIEYSKDLKKFKNKIDSQNSEMSNYINTWLSGEWIYLSEDSEIQNIMKDVLLNSDWIDELPDDIDKTDWDEVSKWLQDNFLEAIAEIDDEEIESQLKNVLSGDFELTELTDLKNLLIKSKDEGGYGFSEDNPIIIWLEEKYTDKKTKEDRVKSFFASDEDKAKVSKMSIEDLEFAAELSIPPGYFKSWEEYENFVKEIIKANEKSIADSRAAMISDLNDMSEGFESLDKIYSSIKDKDPFDFALLDDKEFKETFSVLGGVYSDFIETITSNPDDINACKSAFNDLVTEWVYSTKILDGVSKENSKLTASMLKQMGVANAETIVEDALIRNKEKLAAEEDYAKKQKEGKIKLDQENLEGITDTIEVLMDEADKLGITRSAYAAVLAQEIVFNNQKLNTSDKIKALQELQSQLGLTGAQYSVLNSLLATPEFDNYKDRKAYDRKWAQDNGYDVKVVGVTNDKKFGQVEDWIYVDKNTGAEHDTREEAALAKAPQAITNAYNDLIITDLNFIGGDKANGLNTTKESFDWIEVKISRIQRKITNLGKTVSATWKSWKDRNKALSSEMSALTTEMQTQDDAAKKYLSLANGVTGLTEEEKRRVRNGALRYDDENLSSDKANAIKKYQEFYEKYLAALDAKTDAENSYYEKIQTKFDNTAKQYDNLLSVKQHEANMLDASLETLELQGKVASKSIYQDLISNADAQLSILGNKRSKLEQAMSKVPVGTEMWYEMNSQLLEIDETMKGLENSTLGWNNAIEELDWEKFDELLGRLDRIKSEADFLIDYLSYDDLMNDDGSYTKEGEATLGLQVVKYRTALDEAEKVRQQIADLDVKYANDKENTRYLEERNELEEQYWDYMLEGKETQQSILDMQQEQFDTFLDYMNEMIAKRKELLSQAKEQYDYEKNIAEQAKEVSTLEKQLAAYQGDNSEEARATVQKIKVSLEEAKENLEETQYEKFISDQEQMYDALYEETEEWINERMDDEDALLKDIFESLDENGDIATTIGNLGVSLSDTMTSIFGEGGSLTSTIEEIKEAIENKYKDNDDSGDGASGGSNGGSGKGNSDKNKPNTTAPTDKNNGGDKKSKAITVGGKINAGSAKIYDYAGDKSGERQLYRNDPIYTVLEERNGYLRVRHHKLSKGTTGWFKKSDVKAYKTGGLVDETGLAWLDGTKGKPEMVLSAQDTENFIALKDVLNDVVRSNMFDTISDYTKIPNFVPMGANKTITNHNTFEFNMPGITDANQFITELQYSKRFENIILEITDGNNSLSKYKW